MVGYECNGCGETFLYHNHENDYEALEAAFEHAKDAHNTESTVYGIRE